MLSNKQAEINFQRGPDNCATRTQKKTTGHIATQTCYKDYNGGKTFWWPNMSNEIEENTKSCVACMASGKILSYQLTKNEIRKNHLDNRDKNFELSFAGKLIDKKSNGEHQL